MKKSKPRFAAAFMFCVFGMALLACDGIHQLEAQQPGVSKNAPAGPCEPSKLGSPYIPVDSWVYLAMLRLYSLGYVDQVFMGLRPWTRSNVMHMLEAAGNLIDQSEDGGDPGSNEARGIYVALNHELHYDMEGPCGPHQGGAPSSRCTVWRGASAARHSMTATISGRPS